MRLSFAVAAASSLVVASAALAGDAKPLSGPQLQKFVAGKTVVLHTSIGGVPITYSGNGTMSGAAKSMAMYAGRERDKGRWRVLGDQICQKWDVWLEGKSYCFTFRLDGRTVHWRGLDGRSGTATIASTN